MNLGQIWNLLELNSSKDNGSLLKYRLLTLENLRKMYDPATLIPAVTFALTALILFVFYPLSKNSRYSMSPILIRE